MSKKVVTQVCIDKLQLSSSIGILDWEYEQRQNIEISLVATLKARSIPQTLEDGLSYADMVDQIKAIIEEGHIDLVEHLGQRILDDLFWPNPLIKKMIVEIRKPDVITEAKGVGIKVKAKKPKFNENQFGQKF